LLITLEKNMILKHDKCAAFEEEIKKLNEKIKDLENRLKKYESIEVCVDSEDENSFLKFSSDDI
jgi:hypothetical protein